MQTRNLQVKDSGVSRNGSSQMKKPKEGRTIQDKDTNKADTMHALIEYTPSPILLNKVNYLFAFVLCLLVS